MYEQKKTLKQLANSVNGGWAFEAQMALEKRCKRDGRPGQADLIEKGKITETKFFRVKPAYVDRKGVYHAPVMNSAHGFSPRYKDLNKALQEYCNSMDRFLIAIGPTPETATRYYLSPEKAYQWLLPRIQYSDTYGIRFTWGGDLKPSFVQGRLATLRKKWFSYHCNGKRPCNRTRYH